MRTTTEFQNQTTRIQQSQGYAPDWDIKVDFAKGETAEHQVIDWLASETNGTFTIEVKADLKAMKTTNVYLELSCKGKLSGIMATKATWFTMVFGDTMVTFKTATFKKFVQEKVAELENEPAQSIGCARLTGTNKDANNPTRGLVYNIPWLISDFNAYQTCSGHGE